MQKNCFGWINVSGLKSLDSKAANNYFLYATPSIILLDKNIKIIPKPLSLEELRNIF